MKPKKPKKPLFRILSSILKLIKRKPKIINLNEEIEDCSIFISNHSAANGPLTLSLYFPKLFRPWGIYNMCMGYVTRWKYLYHIFYQQKLGYGKIKSFIIATLFAIISGFIYKTMEVIPSYTDNRLVTSVKLSIKHLENEKAILIFPENSSNGYHQVLEYYNPGFVLLAVQYYKKHQFDVPIYTVYFSKKDKAMIIDKPRYIQDYVNQGLSKDAIADIFKDRTNELYQILLSSIKKHAREL
jgi:hypothetical protein